MQIRQTYLLQAAERLRAARGHGRGGGAGQAAAHRRLPGRTARAHRPRDQVRHLAAALVQRQAAAATAINHPPTMYVTQLDNSSNDYVLSHLQPLTIHCRRLQPIYHADQTCWYSLFRVFLLLAVFITWDTHGMNRAGDYYLKPSPNVM